MPMLQRMKPWMVAVALTAAEISKAGFDSKLGIDQHFFDRAKAIGMPRRALETVAYQFDRLDGLSRHAAGGVAEGDAGRHRRSGAEHRDARDAPGAAGDTATLERLLMEGFARCAGDRRAAPLRA